MSSCWMSPHRQVVFTIPRMLRIFFKYNCRLLGELCRSALCSLTRYFAAVTGRRLMPGVIASIQTFGDRINLHPYLHFLVTEGGVDEAGVFQRVSRIDDSRLASLFAREVLSDLVRKDLLSTEWAERLLSWRHTGFNVHSRVRAKTKSEAERVGKYLIRPLLSLERLSFSEKEGTVCYRYGKEPREVEELRPLPARGWAEMIRKVYEVDPMLCPRCGGQMKVISFLTDWAVVNRIINHLKLTFFADRPPPPQIAYQEVLIAAEAPAEYSS